MAKYKNVSGGIIPLPMHQVAVNGTVELSDEEIETPEIKVYIGKYLSPIEVAPASVVAKPVTEKTTPDGVSVSGGVAKAPKEKTDEELEKEKQEEEDSQTVGVKKSKKTVDGSVVQDIEEVSRGKVRYAVEKIKSIVSWRKRIEYIESIDNRALLEVVKDKVNLKKGKVLDALKKRIKKLSK